MPEIDPFDALGIDTSKLMGGPPTVAQPPQGVGASLAPATSPTIPAEPSGPDPFQSLGVNPNGNYQPTVAPANTTQPGHATSGPSGSFWTDLKNRLATVGADLSGAVYPFEKAMSDAAPNFHAPGAPPLPPTPEKMRDAYFNGTGTTEYVPSGAMDRIGQAGLTGAAAALMNPSSIPATVLGSMSGQATAEAFPNHPALAKMLGFLPGAWVGSRGAGLAAPPAGGFLDAGTAALANSAVKDYDLPLGLGQLSNGVFAKNIYSQGGRIPFSGADAANGKLQDAWNTAIAKEMGQPTVDGKITPEVMAKAKSDLGNGFNEIANRTSIPLSGDMMNALQDVVSNAKLTTSADLHQPIENQAMNIINTAANNNGNIGGRAYISLTGNNGPLDGMRTSGTPGLMNAGSAFRDILDKGLADNAAPGDVEALQKLRSQWKVMRTVQPLTVRADAAGGATPSTGDISPAALRAAVNQSYPNAPFASLGDIPLNDLAKIGQRFLKEPQDSGTPGRTLAQHALGAAGGLGMMVAGHEAGVPLMASAAGAAGTMATNRVLQSILRSPTLAKRQIAASMNPNGFTFPMLPSVAQMPFALTPPIPGQTTSSNSAPP